MKRVILFFGLIFCLILTVNACSTKNRCYRIADMNQPRANHHSVLLDNGNVLLFGGEDLGSDSIELYDHKTKTFKVIYEGKDARFAYYYKLKDRNIFIVAGKKPLLYDQKRNKLIPVKDIPIDISCSSKLKPDNDNQYLITDGKKLALFDFSNNKFEYLTDLYYKRKGYCKIIPQDPPNIVLIKGGDTLNDKYTYAPDEIYNFETNFSSDISPDSPRKFASKFDTGTYGELKIPGKGNLVSGCFNLTMFYKNGTTAIPKRNAIHSYLYSSLLKTRNNDIYTFGGNNDHRGFFWVNYNEVYKYDIDNNRLNLVTRMSQRKAQPAVVELQNGEILITGGYESSGEFMTIEWIKTPLKTADIFKP